MATTPEGRIKKKITSLLNSYGDQVYYFMPVPSGYGRRTVDYLVCICGLFVAIEAKREGGKPTGFQEQVLKDVTKAGGMSMVIDDDEGITILKRFIDLKLEGAR